MKNNKHLIILILIIFLGLSLRLINSQKVLWMDEAETVIKATQITNGELPNAYFKDKILYESYPNLKINDSVYAYASQNFIGSKYENNKGWLPYFYLAPFIKIFGFSELSARLPFFLFYIITTIFIYLFANLLFKNKKIALLAAFLFSIDYFSIDYGRQSRYYSILMFFSILSLYLNYLFIQTQKNKYLFLLTSILILSFHTHIIIAVFMLLYYIYYNLIKSKIKINKYIWFNALYFLLATIPWLILVKFWVNFQTYTSYNLHSFLKLLWVDAIILLLGITFFINLYKLKIIKKFDFNYHKIIKDYLLNFILFYIIIVPLLIPAESYLSRVYSPLIPIISIILAYLSYQIFTNKLTRKKNCTLFFYILILYVFIFNFVSAKFYGQAEFINSINDYTEKTNFSSKDIITINLGWSLVLDIYSPHQVYYDASLNPNYYNNYPGRILSIFNPYIITHSKNNQNFNHQFFINKLEDTFGQRIKTCEQVFIHKDIIAFDCPALK